MTTEIQKVQSPYAPYNVVRREPDEPQSLATIAAGASSSEVQVAQAKAQAEAFAAIMAAKNWPRNEAEAADRLIISCQRPGLAEQAVYVYSRGGQDISGPSIRLAEAAARAWRNVKYGFKVTASDNMHSEVLCYAYDLEANIPVERSFVVSHVRHTRQGSKLLTDPRDIYEKVANEAMRRVRACILECIPGDVIDAAVAQCEETIKATADTSPAAMQKLCKAFEEFGVTKAQIETRIQRRLDAITPAQVLSLRKVYVSLRDGMSKPEDWFQQPQAAQEEAPANGKLAAVLAKKKAEAAEKPEEAPAA